MINFDDVTKETVIEHNVNWPQAFDHPYKILIFGASGSEIFHMLKIHMKQNINF